MKKNKMILAIAMIFMYLLSACNQEEVAQTPTVKSKKVSIGVKTNEVNTRAIPVSPNHSLRCILEVWTTDGRLVHRNEQIRSSGSSNQTFIFDFEVDKGNYSCLLWADLIALNRDGDIEMTTPNSYTHYEDASYKTDSVNHGLKTVSILKRQTQPLNLNNLSEMYAAFSATMPLVKEDNIVNMGSITLRRAVAELTVAEKISATTTSINNAEKMVATYSIPRIFNVLSQEVSGEYKAQIEGTPRKYINSTLYPDMNVAFFDYILASSSGFTLGELQLTFESSKMGTTIRKIPAGIPLRQNYQTMISVENLIFGGIGNTVKISTKIEENFNSDLNEP